MKKGKPLLLSLAVVLLLSIALAGCGGSNTASTSNAKSSKSTSSSGNSGTSKSTSSSSNSGTSKASTGTAAKSKISGTFEIQYFVGGYGDTWWKDMLKQFNAKYPDLKIVQDAGPKINQQMKPRWIQGSPPDLIYIDGAGHLDVPTAIKDGQLMDLTDWYKNVKNVNGKPISNIVIAQPHQFGADKKVYTLPMVFGSWGIFYDKTLFKQKGWAIPTDWQSFLDVSKKIKASGMYPFVHAGIYPAYIEGGFLFPAIVSANGDDPGILNDIADLKPGVFKSPAIMKALQQLVTLRDKGYIDPASPAINHTDSQLQFLHHKDAFIPNGLWVENEMKKDTPKGFQFGYIPSVTQAAGHKYIADAYTATIAIAKKAKNPAAAKAFIQFIMTKQRAVTWAQDTGAIMNIKASADVATSNASDLTKTALKYFSSPNLVVLPVEPYNADVIKAIDNATVALSSNKKFTPQDWVNQVSKAADKARKNQ